MRGFLLLALAFFGTANSLSLEGQKDDGYYSPDEYDVEGVWPDADGWWPLNRNPDYFTIMVD